MSRVEYDYEWARAQLEGTGLTTKGRKTVIAVLEALEAAETPDAEAALRVLQAATSLSQGHSLDTRREELVAWVQLRPGEYKRGARVRVAPDAYEGDVGALHNGRAGRVVRVSGLKVSVAYDDLLARDAVLHSPTKLQRPA